MLKRWTVVCGALTLSLGLGACSDDDDPGGQSLTASQAQSAWSSIEVAVKAAQSEISGDMQAKDRGKGDSHNSGADGGGDVLHKDGGGDQLNSDGGAGGGWISGTLTSFTIEGTVDNPTGAGTATVSGTGGVMASGYGVSVTITFSGWEANGLTIDGPITVELNISKLVPFTAVLTVGGTVQVDTGLFKVPAVADVTVTVEGATSTVCGTIAGQPVGEGPCS